MIESISSEFGVSSKAVKLIYDEYAAKVNGLMEKQYLGHSIRAIEEFAYLERGRKPVHIVCRELHGSRFPVYSDYTSYFLIGYPPNVDEKDVRYGIAHELGHLFFNTKLHEGLYKEEDENNLEAVANIFGLLVILGRKGFYDGKTDPFKDANLDDILTDYKKVCTRTRAKP